MPGLLQRIAWFSGGAGRREFERVRQFERARRHAGFGASVPQNGARPDRTAAMPGLPHPRVIAELRRNLERAVQENSPDQVRDAMRDVVAVLGRSLPLALPAPGAAFATAPAPVEPPPSQGQSPHASLSREELAKLLRAWDAPVPEGLIRPRRPPEGLMDRLRRSTGAVPDRPSWSALPWTDATEVPVAKRIRRF